MSDYQINITKANGIKSYRWTVTGPDGVAHTDGRTAKSESLARSRAQEHIDNVTGYVPAPKAAPAQEPAAKPAPKGWSRYSRPAGQASVHRVMESTFGVSSPSYARGECHYCGQSLNRGRCEECDS